MAATDSDSSSPIPEDGGDDAIFLNADGLKELEKEVIIGRTPLGVLRQAIYEDDVVAVLSLKRPPTDARPKKSRPLRRALRDACLAACRSLMAINSEHVVGIRGVIMKPNGKTMSVVMEPLRPLFPTYNMPLSRMAWEAVAADVIRSIVVLDKNRLAPKLTIGNLFVANDGRVKIVDLGSTVISPWTSPTNSQVNLAGINLPRITNVIDLLRELARVSPPLSHKTELLENISSGWENVEERIAQVREVVFRARHGAAAAAIDACLDPRKWASLRDLEQAILSLPNATTDVVEINVNNCASRIARYSQGEEFFWSSNDNPRPSAAAAADTEAQSEAQATASPTKTTQFEASSMTPKRPDQMPACQSPEKSSDFPTPQANVMATPLFSDSDGEATERLSSGMSDTSRTRSTLLTPEEPDEMPTRTVYLQSIPENEEPMLPYNGPAGLRIPTPELHVESFTPVVSAISPKAVIPGDYSTSSSTSYEDSPYSTTTSSPRSNSPLPTTDVNSAGPSSASEVDLILQELRDLIPQLIFASDTNPVFAEIACQLRDFCEQRVGGVPDELEFSLPLMHALATSGESERCLSVADRYLKRLNLKQSSDGDVERVVNELVRVTKVFLNKSQFSGVGATLTSKVNEFVKWRVGVSLDLVSAINDLILVSSKTPRQREFKAILEDVIRKAARHRKVRSSDSFSFSDGDLLALESEYLVPHIAALKERVVAARGQPNAPALVDSLVASAVEHAKAGDLFSAIRELHLALEAGRGIITPDKKLSMLRQYRRLLLNAMHPPEQVFNQSVVSRARRALALVREKAIAARKASDSPLEVQNAFTNDVITNVIRPLIAEAVRQAGPCECRLAFVGMGSMANAAMSLFSDLEFALVLDKPFNEVEKYVTRVVNLLELNIAALGETCRDGVHYVAGLSFDSGHNTPLQQDLAGTPDELVRHLTKGEMQDDLTIVCNLASPCFLDGDAALYHDFTARCAEVLGSCEKPDSRRVVYALKLLERATDFVSNKIDVSQQMDVKALLYRLPSMTVNALALLFGIERTPEPMPFSVIVRCLCDIGKLSPAIGQTLIDLLGLSASLRLRAHEFYDTEEDYVFRGCNGPADTMHTTFVLEDGEYGMVLQTLRRTVQPLQRCVNDYLSHLASDRATAPQPLTDVTRFHDARVASEIAKTSSVAGKDDALGLLLDGCMCGHIDSSIFDFDQGEIVLEKDTQVRLCPSRSHPGAQYLCSQLGHVLAAHVPGAGTLAPAADILVLRSPLLPRVFVASEVILGELLPLDQALERDPDILAKWHPVDYSTFVIFTLLICPADANPTKFAARLRPDGSSCDIFCLDNEHTLLAPTFDNGFTFADGRAVGLKSFPLCLDQMHKPLHPTVRDCIARLSPSETVHDLLNALLRLDNRIGELLTSQELDSIMRQHQCCVPPVIASQVVSDLHDRLSRVVQMCKEGGTYTHLEYLRRVCGDELCQMYCTVLNRTGGPLERFNALKKASDKLMKQSRSDAALSRVHNIGVAKPQSVTDAHRKFSIQQALSDFSKMNASRESCLAAAREIEQGSVEKFRKLSLELQSKVFGETLWEQVFLKDSGSLGRILGCIVGALQSGVLDSFVMKSTRLGVVNGMALLRQMPLYHLVEINLENNFLDSWQPLPQKCPMLEHISLRGCEIGSGELTLDGPADLPRLNTLNLRDVRNLKKLVVPRKTVTIITRDTLWEDETITWRSAAGPHWVNNTYAFDGLPREQHWKFDNLHPVYAGVAPYLKKYLKDDCKSVEQMYTVALRAIGTQHHDLVETVMGALVCDRFHDKTGIRQVIEIINKSCEVHLYEPAVNGALHKVLLHLGTLGSPGSNTESLDATNVDAIEMFAQISPLALSVSLLDHLCKSLQPEWVVAHLVLMVRFYGEISQSSPALHTHERFVKLLHTGVQSAVTNRDLCFTERHFRCLGVILNSKRVDLPGAVELIFDELLVRLNDGTQDWMRTAHILCQVSPEPCIENHNLYVSLTKDVAAAFASAECAVPTMAPMLGKLLRMNIPVLMQAVWEILTTNVTRVAADINSCLLLIEATSVAMSRGREINPLYPTARACVESLIRAARQNVDTWKEFLRHGQVLDGQLANDSFHIFVLELSVGPFSVSSAQV